MRGVSSVMVFGLTACGRIGFGLEVDAALPIELDPTLDGPRVIDELLDPMFNVDAPSATGDLLELYFDSDRMGSLDLWVSTRSSASAPWGPPTPLTELNTTFIDATPEVSRDGLTMYFSTTRSAGTGLDIYITTRPDRQSQWGPPSRADAPFNTSLQEGERDATATNDQLSVVFCSSRSGATGWELYEAKRASIGEGFGAAAIITELNAPQHECGTHIDADGLVLWFDSNRSGGSGSQDLYFATRASREAPFDPPTRIVSVATSSVEGDLWVDLVSGYAMFATDRTGKNELWESRWPF